MSGHGGADADTSTLALHHTLGTGHNQASPGDHSHTGYVPESVVTTKGDVLVATGSGAVSREPVGANGTVLMADSTQATGVKWGTVTGGSVINQTLRGTVNPTSGGTTNFTIPTVNTAKTQLRSVGSENLSSSAPTAFLIAVASSTQLSVTQLLNTNLTAGYDLTEWT